MRMVLEAQPFLHHIQYIVCPEFSRIDLYAVYTSEEQAVRRLQFVIEKIETGQKACDGCDTMLLLRCSLSEFET